MPIRFRCQDCRSRVKVPEGTQGKQVKCPRCGRIQTVPKHANMNADSTADGMTVHTLVGSMHKAPKRKEALVGAGASSDRFSGGGVPGGLDIPDLSERDEFNEVQKNRISRKQRRKMEARARMAQREREEALAREEAAQEDAAREESIAESRRRVEDIFATSKHKQMNAEAEERPEAVKPERPAAIALNGNGNGKVRRESFVAEPARIHEAEPQTVEHHVEDAGEASGWSFDMTGEAYPFLKIIPWVLRITALMLIGPAFKVMLVAGDRGFSGVVCMLILFAGLALVVVTWTVGEIATAVRDIAMRKAAAQT